MCADGWDRSEEWNGDYCPDCGDRVDDDGDAIEGCNYAREYCETCGGGACDGSC